MIVRDRPNWLRLRFVWRGSILSQILPQLLAALGFAVLVTLVHGQVWRWKVPLNFVPFSLLASRWRSFSAFATAPATAAGGKRACCGASCSSPAARRCARR